MTWKCLQTVTPKTYMRVQILLFRELTFNLRAKYGQLMEFHFLGAFCKSTLSSFRSIYTWFRKAKNLSFNTKISIQFKYLSSVLEENNTNRPNCITVTSYKKKCATKENIPAVTQFIRLWLHDGKNLLINTTHKEN